uniref:Uncharacterized protein n=3 Tax=Candidatus Berkiella cookevillensis TaxID=437022 RepID=A0A0Q9YHM4_9GAMM
MLHFNRNDIHEWNISKEVFDAMIKDYGFKIDESKISIEALYTNALANLRNDAEKSFKFLKQEKSTAEEIRDQSFEEKTKIENFFTNALMIEVAKLIQDEKFQKHVLIENLKKANLAYIDFLHRHSNEVNARILADVSLQEQADMLMQEQQLAFDAYMDDVGNKLSNLQAKADALRAEGKMLEAHRKELAKQMGKNMAQEFDGLRDEKGEPYLKGVPQERKEEYFADLMAEFASIEVQAEKEVEKVNADIAHIDARLSHLEKQIYGEKSSVPFHSNNGAVLATFTGQRKTHPWQEEINNLKQAKAALVEFVNDTEARILKDQQAAIHSIADKHGISAEAASLSVETIKATKAYQTAAESLKEVTKNVDVNLDAQHEVREEAAAEIKDVEKNIAEVRSEIKDLDKMIQLEEQIAKMLESMPEKANANESRRIHASP